MLALSNLIRHTFLNFFEIRKVVLKLISTSGRNEHFAIGNVSSDILDGIVETEQTALLSLIRLDNEGMVQLPSNMSFHLITYV